MGLIEFWTTGLLIMVGVTYWARRMSKRPGASRSLSWLVWIPACAWLVSTMISAFFLWRSGQYAELAADQRALHLARNLTWSMRTALVGSGVIALAAVWLGLLHLLGLKKKAQAKKKGRKK